MYVPYVCMSVLSLRMLLCDDESDIATQVLRGLKTLFVYCCPDNATRTTRTLYASAKAHVIETMQVLNHSLHPSAHCVQSHDIHVDIKMEISEPDDITDSDLRGDIKTAAVPEVEDEANSTVKKHPTEERGSLSVRRGGHTCHVT